MKKIVFTLLISLFVVLPSYQANKNNEVFSPDDIRSWKETKDIKEKKKGKYNILITAEDIAGNESTSVPFNIFIDPTSDLPITRIINPMNASVITGNINIVGTCVDDDGIDHVEIFIDDDEEAKKASGKDFWSYFLNTKDMLEGIHTITAYGVDINGVKGTPCKATFKLNRKKPTTHITNLQVGSLVSGNFTLEGTCQDGNGIEKLFYSLDEGKTFQKVKISYNKKEDLWKFRLNINTNTMEDGAKTCYFKAFDKLDGQGTYAFLFFVDNTPPELEFVYPSGDEVIQGSVFAVAGKAKDVNNLSSLEYSIGRNKGNMELIPGNPYWVKEFDLSQESSSSYVISITAKDKAGNIVKKEKNIKLDRSKDIPIINITNIPTIQNDTNITIEENLTTSIEDRETSLYISGFVSDIYGVEDVYYKVEGYPEHHYKSDFGAFNIDLSNYNIEGENTVSIYAVNKRGIKSNIVKQKIFGRNKGPKINFPNGQTIITQKVNFGKTFTPQVVIKAFKGLSSASYSINEGEEQTINVKIGATEQKVNILPIEAKEGTKMLEIAFQALDTEGIKIYQKLLVILEQLEDVPATETEPQKELFAWAHGRKDTDGSVLMDLGSELSAAFIPKSNEEIKEVKLLADEGLTLEEGNQLKIRAVRSGLYRNVRLQIKTENSSFTSSGINILAGKKDIAITLSANNQGYVVKNTHNMEGIISSQDEIREVRYIAFQKGNENIRKEEVLQRKAGTFTKILNLEDFEEGLILVQVVAEDIKGKKESSNRVLYKVTQNPKVEMILPQAEDVVNGTLLTCFNVSSPLPTSFIRGEYESGKGKGKILEGSSFKYILIGSAEEPISRAMKFKFTDIGGNVAKIEDYSFNIDAKEDSPVVKLQLPLDNEIVCDDFVVSGIIYDDDAPAKIYYKWDEGEYKSLDVENSFAINIPITNLEDNEHTITIYGEDIYGVKGATVKKKVRVSRSLPHSSVTTPSLLESVKGIVNFTGTANDKNGIKYVELSFDNGNTYNRAEGGQNWQYSVNTQVIEDGTHIVLVRAFDNYGLFDVFSILINIDNTAPDLKISYPVSGAKVDNTLVVSGKIQDNIALDSASLRIRSLEGLSVPSSLSEIKLSTDPLVTRKLDVSSLKEGKYNLSFKAMDKANNVTEISSNFEIYRSKDKDKVELFYPLSGERINGEFNVYGKVLQSEEIEKASLLIDGKEVKSSEVSKTGFVVFRFSSEELSTGMHKILIRARGNSNVEYTSNENTIFYSQEGAWITIDELNMGDFAFNRPYIKGRAGYTVIKKEENIENTNSEEKPLEEKKNVGVAKIELSLDNGLTFNTISKGKNWKYRIETGNLSEGEHFFLFRATMKNDEVALCRTLVKVDKTLPEITIISPIEGEKYNDEIEFIGLAQDDRELKNVKIELRKGDKFFYGVPKFIQGLHFELGFWGASLWNMGMGLSFFEQNVKLQLHYGQFTQGQRNVVLKERADLVRYGGHIVSMKILANVFSYGFGYHFPDAAPLYMAVALGAQFSLFTETQSGRPQVLSSLLMQLEFPRIKLPKGKYFRSFSFFTEGQLWFVPTDVSSKNVASKIQSIVPHLACGIRVDVF
ncbi:MAG: Ig-like domain-containing protein [Treponema sp.]